VKDPEKRLGVKHALKASRQHFQRVSAPKRGSILTGSRGRSPSKTKTTTPSPTKKHRRGGSGDDGCSGSGGGDSPFGSDSNSDSMSPSALTASALASAHTLLSCSGGMNPFESLKSHEFFKGVDWQVGLVFV
jgi:hypothetical protein